MKRIITSTVTFLLFVVQARGQSINMRILLDDAKTEMYKIDSIESISFLNADKYPKYSIFNIFSSVTTAPYFRFELKNVDSMNFFYDGSQIARLRLFGDNIGGVTNFVLAGKHEFGPNAPIDSIIFNTYEIDTNVIVLSEYWPYLNCANQSREYGIPQCATWVDDGIFVSSPLTRNSIDSIITPTIPDTTFCPLMTAKIFSCNLSANKFLFVASHFTDIQAGPLYLYQIGVGKQRLLDESDSLVSFARFFGEDSIVYYSYGTLSQSNIDPPDAGYYIYDLKSKNKTFIYHYISEIGPQEMVNGFDVSPDRSILIIPSIGYRVPMVIRYDIKKKRADTLGITFSNEDSNRRGLWLRFNIDGTKILYSNYPFGSIEGEPGYHSGKLGLIDLVSLQNRDLKFAPTDEGLSVPLWPDWSPDGKMVCFVNGIVSDEPAGSLSKFKLCVLKNLNVP